jgi:uncharacterized protein
VLVVIDTNVLISYFIRYRSPVGLAVDSIFAQVDTLNEFVGKIGSPKFSKYVSTETIRRFVDRFTAGGRLVADVPTIQACRDPKDDKYLALAIGGSADCIVSGDRDLLDLHPFQDVPILTPAEFVQRYMSAPPE